jgi:hypothetical protein
MSDEPGCMWLSGSYLLKKLLHRLWRVCRLSYKQQKKQGEKMQFKKADTQTSQRIFDNPLG